MKFIGITLRHVQMGGSRLCAASNYLAILEKYNCIPLFLPPITQSNLPQLLQQCSGFIITGGDDIDPRFYNQQRENGTIVNIADDVLDFAVIDYALKNNKPILGICRGLQAVNIYFDGTLQQNLPEINRFFHLRGNHDIKIINLSACPEINNQIYNVYSLHHQAVGRLGKDLTVIARSHDSVIEGFMNKAKQIYCFQWHIESDINNFLSKQLFNLFFADIHR